MKLKTVASLLFISSFRLAKSSPNKIGLTILFDALFLVSAFVLQRLFQYSAKSLFVTTDTATLTIFIILSLIYYLAILFAYSFFKYGILDFTKSMFSKTSFSFARFWQFYSLNIIIAGIFYAVMLLLNSILISIKQPYAPFVFVFLAVPYLLILYVIINLAHSLFYEGDSIKDALKKSFSIAFTKIRNYRETILILILFAFFLWLLFLGSGYLVRVLASKNYTLYLTTYTYFKQISIIVFDAVFYLIILINRISFYKIAREIK